MNKTISLSIDPEEVYNNLVNMAGQNNFGLTQTYFNSLYKNKDFWHIRQPDRLSKKTFDSFVDFANYEVPWGLGFDLDVIKACCKREPNIWNEYLDKLPKTAKHGGNRKKDYIKASTYKGGNNKEYLIQKLKKEHPEIASEVISGKISANKGMIKAGLRQETVSIKFNPKDISEKIISNLDPIDIKKIFEALKTHLETVEGLRT